MQSKLEKENLEAHVDLCAERYKTLENSGRTLANRLDGIQKDFKEDRKVIHDRIDRVKDSISDLREYLVEQQSSQNKIIITSAIAIIVALLGGIFMMNT
jgi:hypothetical protein